MSAKEQRNTYPSNVLLSNRHGDHGRSWFGECHTPQNPQGSLIIRELNAADLVVVGERGEVVVVMGREVEGEVFGEGERSESSERKDRELHVAFRKSDEDEWQ